MVDIHAIFGSLRKKITYVLLMRALELQRVSVETGDILCIHTGFAGALVQRPSSQTRKALAGQYCELDGSDPALLRWITDSKIAAIATDNAGVEGPSLDVEMHGNHSHVLPLHHHCLFKLGMPLGELWHLSELAAWLQDAGRNRFLLTAPPLNLPGAVGCL